VKLCVPRVDAGSGTRLNCEIDRMDLIYFLAGKCKDKGAYT